ncbi:MAG: hypothetical protein JO257_01330 [Deltaproteobacteria bacterium]|nr:hypothetical protein [Deltaproteobacteria bacterium]
MKTTWFLPLALAACVDHQPPITGTQSLQVTLTSPTDPGDIDHRLPDTARSVTLSVTAKGPNGDTDTTFSNKLQVYAHFLGTLTPYLGGMPLATVSMNQGQGTVSLMLPSAFGPTTVWIDDFTDGDSATYATGVSPTLWYRDPFIADIQTPRSETAVDALDAAPLDTKNVDVRASRYGAQGRLVVTSVYTQGYTVADVKCQDANGTPPCVSADYDYMDVFSYSAPLDQDKRFLSEGQVIAGFAGGVSEFDSLTEIGFPQTFVVGAPMVNKAMEPKPVVFDTTWFNAPINFEHNESGLIEIDNAKVCNLDADYVTYKQWKLDPAGIGGNCQSSFINVVTAGTLDLDPATLVGKTLPKVIGVSRPILKHWIIFPRSMSDIVTQ